MVKQTIVLLIASFFLGFTSESVAQTPCRGVKFSTYNDADFVKLTDMNVNLIRYDLIWDDSTAADNSNSTTFNAWLDDELDDFDVVLAKLKAINIPAIIVLHTPPGGFATRVGKVTHKIFTESWAQAEIVAAWQKIATRYLGETGIHAFEILNEPAQFDDAVTAGLKDWNGLAVDIVAAIRAIDTVHPVITSSRFGDPTKYNKMDVIPYDNVLYTFHFYYPFQYTHQGIFTKKWKKRFYPNPTLNKKKLQKVMKNAFKFQEQNNVELIVTEFATARWAPGGDKYLKDVIDIFEKKEICWTYESFGTVDVWSFEYTKNKNDKTKSTTMTAREALLREYFTKN
ncbi:MAG: cellulase family glycosylhydrolase [bacterium]|nr:cellulase family glycosylhydrolase [bacterium]